MDFVKLEKGPAVVWKLHTKHITYQDYLQDCYKYMNGNHQLMKCKLVNNLGVQWANYEDICKRGTTNITMPKGELI